jgi:hypothetical protein
MLIISQVVNAFRSLGNKKCISVIKLSKLPIGIKKSTFCSCFLYCIKCGERLIKILRLYIDNFVSVRFIIVVIKCWVTIATNCRYTKVDCVSG